MIYEKGIEMLKNVIKDTYDKGWKAGRIDNSELSDTDIWAGYMECMQTSTNAFKAGVKYAERKHGIGL